MRSREHSFQTPDFPTRLVGARTHGSSLVCYQPIVNAQSHRMVGCALVLPPARSTPQAQGSTKAFEIEEWIEALTCLQAWRKPGGNLSLLAPVSEQQLHSPTFIAHLMRALEQLALPASAIELEIAEHVLLGHADFMRDHLNALLASGFSILCGELGRNHSSLAQWRDTPMTGLRIDETLTRQPQARESGVVIEALLMIASTCGLCTIATGVQDADAAAVLSLLGVQRLQGRHFGEPMDCRDFERLLERDRHAP